MSLTIYLLIYIGNARLAGLERDLLLHGYDFNIALSCFAISYAVCEIPAAVCCKWIGPGYFLPGCTIAFGLASIGTGLVQSRAQLFTVRVLLGIFESALFPGIAYYMSRWYRRAELGFRLSFYVATAPLAGAFGGLLASAILKLPSFGGLHGWRMIFAIEGIITIMLGIIGLVFLTDRPETARWLTPEERRFVANRLLSERVATTELLDKIDRIKVWRGMKNPITLATGVLFFMNAFTVQGLVFFLPTIVATIYPNASAVQQQLYTVPPYVIGVVFTLKLSGVSWWVDKRQILLILSSLPVLVAYALFISTLNPQVRYAASFLVASTAFVPGSMTTAQVSANVVSDTARSVAIGTNVMFGALGVSCLLVRDRALTQQLTFFSGKGVLATWAFLPFDSPYYRIGNGLNLGTSSVWMLDGLGLLVWMYFNNKRRSLVDIEERLAGMSQSQVEDLDWKHPAFRWKV